MAATPHDEHIPGAGAKEVLSRPPASCVPLVGREGVLKTLHARLEQASHGWGGRVAIRATSGLGKTRLAEELGAAAASEGFRVTHLMCRGSALRPYQPMADLVRALLEIDPHLQDEAQRLALSRSLAALGVPDFETSFARLLRIEGSGSASAVPPLFPPSPDSRDELDADATLHDLTLHTDLGELLRLTLQASAAYAGRLLLILDDLGEAPPITTSALLRLLEGLEHSPVLVLATFLPDAPRELQENFGDGGMLLAPLSREETLELASAFLHLTWITKELADVFWEHAAGNPLLVRLLAEYLYEHKRITVRRQDGLGDLAGEGAIPALAEIIVERAARLPTEPLMTLLNAVILGDGFRVGALGALHDGRHEADLIADLDLLVQAGLLEQTGSGRRAIFRFPHALIRDTLYNSAPPDRRAYLHKRAGDYYALPTAGRRLRLESAVYHYLQAGKPDRAMAMIEAGLQMAHKSANQAEVIALYRAGLKIASRLPEMAIRQTELAEELGDLFVAAGDYRQAAAAYRQADLEASSVEQRGKLGLSLLSVNPLQATSLLARLVDEIPPDYPNDLRWRLEAGLAWGLALAGRTYEALRHSRDSLGTLSSTSGFGSARTLMRGTLGMALYYHGDHAEAAPHLESARAGYSARGDEKGVMFINQILIGMPREEVTQAWLDLVLRPLVRPPASQARS